MGTIDNINDLNKSDFLSIFGNVFEKTESVAQEAFETKPFKDFDDIIIKMLTIYENYKRDKTNISDKKNIPDDKLIFLKAISNVIKSGMNILGVETPEKM